MSALYVSTYSTIRTSNKVNQESEEVADMMKRLDAKIMNIQEKLVVATDRISQKFNELDRDVALLGEIITAQPKLNDAVKQTVLKMHEVKLKIDKLKRELRNGQPVPMVLLELFNLTDVVSTNTLKHSTVISHSMSGDELNIRITLLKLNPSAIIMKGDAFTYRAIKDKLICEFKYTGLEYALFNSTSKCVRPLSSDEIINNVVIGRGCLRREILVLNFMNPKIVVNGPNQI